MAIQLIDYGTPEYEQMLDLRYNVLRKPLGIDFNPEALEKEKDDILIACYDDGNIEGCCILTHEDNATVQLRQMAVRSGLQGKGIGRVLMQFAENIAHDRGYKKMTMHARKSAAGFYEKLGYCIIGDEFEEVSVSHIIMEKKL